MLKNKIIGILIMILICIIQFRIVIANDIVDEYQNYNVKDFYISEEDFEITTDSGFLIQAIADFEGIGRKIITNFVTWESSNKDIIDITKREDNSIEIIAKNKGIAKLTAYYRGLSCSVNISVIDNYSDNNIEYIIPIGSNNTFIFQLGNTKFIINDVEKETGLKNKGVPFIVNDVIMLPIESIIKELGGTTFWNETEQKLKISYKDNDISLWVGNNKVTVNNKNITIDTNTEMVEGVCMVSSNFISSSLGLELYIDNEEEKVILTN